MARPRRRRLGADVAVELSKRVNDRLAATVARYPKRLAAFRRAADSGRKRRGRRAFRTVEKLGFKGAMLHGLAHGLFLDDKRFWPIFARAEALDVPIYLHPATPHPAVMDIYYKDYAEGFSDGDPRRVGLHGRDRDARVRLVLSRRVRAASEAQDRARAFRRDAAVLHLAHRSGAERGRGKSR